MSFIESTRDFVCIRIETYESEESEKIVRSILGGRFANTAFCIFDSAGKGRLSRSGRSPNSLVGRRAGGDDAVIKEMKRIASSHKPTKRSGPALLQDFDTFRQALNVASADQRLLIAVTSSNTRTRDNIRKVLTDKGFVGKFHVDEVDSKSDRNWKKFISGESNAPGILIVRSGEFGLQGEVMTQLSASASVNEIKRALIESNTKFASLETRKVHNKHVAAGLKKGVYFENEIPYGEDRDGDGEIDKQPRKGRASS